jgi:hypothetical protein
MVLTTGCTHDMQTVDSSVRTTTSGMDAKYNHLESGDCAALTNVACMQDMYQHSTSSCYYQGRIE